MGDVAAVGVVPLHLRPLSDPILPLSAAGPREMGSGFEGSQLARLGIGFLRESPGSRTPLRFLPASRGTLMVQSFPARVTAPHHVEGNVKPFAWASPSKHGV